MNETQSCLKNEQLRRLMECELAAADVAQVEDHLSVCEHCRVKLDRAIGNADWWQEAREWLAHPEGDRPPADEAADDAKSAHCDVVALLGPTDDPHMLGRIGAYEIVGILGRGGMGVVFKGFDGALNRYVAIKMLLPHLAASGAARKRFAREAQAAAAVVHDHVMAIHSVAEWQGVPYLVMPYGRGVSLQKRLNEQGPLDVREILRIGMQTAAGLAAAHAQGLVHRDVKPANILLAEDVERVTLTDFGLARAVDDASLTRVGTLAGTPQYMSPEQARGKAVDARSDLFSLGSVLYAMCTGRAPFRADSSYGTLRLITDDEPTPIREINPEIPEWLCTIVAKLMSKRASDRFESAAEVAALLAACLAHVQQPTAVPLPAVLVPHARSRHWFFNVPRQGVLAMFGALGVSLLALVLWQAFVGEPKAGSEAAPQPPAVGEIELIAVTNYPNQKNVWWKPDGRILPDAPVDGTHLDIRSFADPKLSWYTVLFRIPGGLDTDIGGDRIQGTKQPWIWCGRQFRDSRHVDNLQALAITQPVNAAQGDVSIQVAQGNWRTVATVDVPRLLEKDTTTEATTKWQVMDRTDGLQLVVDYPHGNVQSRVALRRGGEITFASSIYSASPTDGQDRNEAKFSKTELTRGEFILQTRPFKIVEFRNVALQGNSKPVATPKRLQSFTTESRVTRIDYSADGKLIAIANDASTFPANADWKRGASILDAETGKTIVSLQITTMSEYTVLAATNRVRPSKVEAIAFSPDGNVVAVGTSLGQVKLFNSRTGVLLQSLEDEKARILELGTPDTLKKSTPITRAMGTVASLVFSPDGGLLAMCGSSLDDAPLFPVGSARPDPSSTGPGRLKVWDVKAGTLKHDLVGHSQATAVAFSPDGNFLGSAGSWENDGKLETGVILWSPPDGTKVRAFTIDANDGTRSIAFSPNKKQVAIGEQRFDKETEASTGIVSLADVETGMIAWQITVVGWAKPVAFSPDGQSVAVLCGGKSIRIVETATGAVKHEIRAVDSPNSGRWSDFAITPQGPRLAIGGIRLGPAKALLTRSVKGALSFGTWRVPPPPLFRTLRQIGRAGRMDKTRALQKGKTRGTANAKNSGCRSADPGRRVGPEGPTYSKIRVDRSLAERRCSYHPSEV